MKNDDFLNAVYCSFKEFLRAETSSSVERICFLYNAITEDIGRRLGDEYSVVSCGEADGAEEEISGRYFNKKVDITIMKDDKAVAGIGVKFVMQNYSQNSNNYFENMLGETANIRANGHPYFQIFIIFDRLPYYDRNKNIKAWETITAHNIEKYRILSEDNIYAFFHTPNKTLIYVVHISDNKNLASQKEYIDYYRTINSKITLSDSVQNDFGSSVVLNDYESFVSKVCYSVMAL